jgi:hypothetical protein
MRRSLAAMAIGLALAAWALTLGSSVAQGGISVDSASAVNQFPDGVMFSVSLRSDAEISKVRFRYTIPPDGTNVYEEPDCTSGSAVKCTFNLKSGPELFLVPGANVVYEDDRFDWKSVSEGNLTLWYYEGSESDVRPLLDTGNEGLQRMESLLGTSVGFPVKVFLYASSDDMRPAVYSSSEMPVEGVITLGEVYFSDTAVVSADTAPRDILRHELAHIVIRQAVKGPFGNIPAWLDEGTAVYAQSSPLFGQEEAVDLAIKSNNVLSLRSMNSASLGHSSTNVSLFYGQSWSVVSFLVDEYGADKFAQLFAVFKEGSTADKAFSQVYGFDLDGLENAWRQSVGLAPRQEATPEETQTAQPVPTLNPFGSDGQDGGTGSETAGGGSNHRLLFIIVGVAALGALVLTAAGVAVARRSH